jgi:hypothetical protein
VKARYEIGGSCGPFGRLGGYGRTVVAVAPYEGKYPYWFQFDVTYVNPTTGVVSTLSVPAREVSR